MFIAMRIRGKKQFLTNGGRDFRVICAMSGDRVHCSFLSDRSMSKHLHAQVKGSNFALLYVEAYVINVVCS